MGNVDKARVMLKGALEKDKVSPLLIYHWQKIPDQVLVENVCKEGCEIPFKVLLKKLGASLIEP